MKSTLVSAGLFAGLWLCGVPVSTQASEDSRICGVIARPNDGCDRALVVLCDQASGEPLCQQSMQPFTLELSATNDQAAMNWVQVLPDAAGNFLFTNVPAGKYIVVAQAWNSDIQPTNILKFHAETVHLLGREEVAVPSVAAGRLRLHSPGTNRIQLDQQFGNDDGWLMLGTRPPRGDPVLGWLGWGTNFTGHLIGCNLMPHGRTIVHGLPDEAYAAIFMPDNSPGFGSMRLRFDGTNAFKMPIVAGWSDGYKTPPTNLAWLVALLQTNKFNIDELLGMPSKRPVSQGFIQREQEMSRRLLPMWEKEIVLPTGQKTRVVDLLTALGYARLNAPK